MNAFRVSFHVFICKFECHTVLGARSVGQNISKTADLLEFSYTITSRFYKNDQKKKKIPLSNHSVSRSPLLINLFGGEWQKWFKLI